MKIKRALSTQNLYDKKNENFDFEEAWANEVLGHPQKSGIWLVWGSQKNGKTWFMMILSRMLSNYEPVLYISGEEGTRQSFIDALKRAKIPANIRGLNFLAYEPLESLRVRLKRKKAPRIVVIDNATVYNREFARGKFEAFVDEFPNVLFIILAHEKQKQPYTAPAQMAAILADIIFYVKGLEVFVSARCPGGVLIIDEERAALYHGQPDQTKFRIA